MNNIITTFTLFIFTLFIFTLISLSNTSVASEPTELIIQKSLNINLSKEQVWSALTNETELAKWWNQDVRLEPYVGGEFYEPWGDNQLATGTVLSVTPLETIKFTWKEKSWKAVEETICEFSIEENNGTTTLKIRHFGWETFPTATQKQMVDGFNSGWDSLLLKFKSYIDSQK